MEEHEYDPGLKDDAYILKLITVNPDVLSGTPVVRDLPISVGKVLRMLAYGKEPKDIIRELPDLNSEDIQACLVYAYGSVAYDNVNDYITVREPTK